MGPFIIGTQSSASATQDFTFYNTAVPRFVENGSMTKDKPTIISFVSLPQRPGRHRVALQKLRL